jgi:hypothetical protein
VGGGHYRTFVNDGIMEKDSAGLLEALAGSTLFSSELTGVSLSKCDVLVGGFVGYSPTDAEEDAATALEGFMTIRTPAGTAPQVFIRVKLPRECRSVAACGADEGMR